MVYTATTFKYAFDYKPSDVYWYSSNSVHTEYRNLLCYLLIHSETSKHFLFFSYRCTADCGWITGHSYVTYGPMLNGASVVVFEGVMAKKLMNTV